MTERQSIDRHPEAISASHDEKTSRLPEVLARLPEIGAGLAEENTPTAGRKRPRHPENSSADPESEILNLNSYMNPNLIREAAASPSPHAADSAARSKEPDPNRMRTERDKLRNTAGLRLRGAQ